jgi:hypothetical protein
MRKLILVATLCLLSATAQAGVSRGLTLASNDEPAAAQQPKASEQKASEQKASEQKPVETPTSVDATKPVEAPKYIERPAAVATTPPAPQADQAKPVAEKNIQTPKAERPKRRHGTTEARVIYELHRHGIYW